MRLENNCENVSKPGHKHCSWEQIMKAGYLGTVTRTVPASLNEE